MKCTGIQRLFDAYWDDETTQAEREVIEAHFASCPDCRARYEAHSRTLELMASLPRLEAAPGLVERVLAGARRASPAPDRIPASPSPAWVPAVAVAAVLMVGALAILPWAVRQPGRFASRSATGALPQPQLVAATGPGAAASGGPSPGRSASSARVAAVTDSLFDHSEDVEFILDPVAVRHEVAGKTNSVNGIRAGRAVISF